MIKPRVAALPVFTLCLALASILLAGAAQAERRVALVIGNGAYQHAPALRNPANDARDMAVLLRGLDFEVESGRDLDRAGMERLIRSFGRSAAGAEVALVFYAGHGLQVDGENWLLPVDARLEDSLDLEFEAVGLNTLLRSLGGASARILLMDACRDNPLASQMRMTGGSRSVGRGLARVETADVGTLIAFATAPGATASDGSGQNSPFTAGLLEHLGEPGLELRQAMTRVRQSVLEATGNRQTPWENASLTRDLYLAGAPTVEAAPPADPTPLSPVVPQAPSFDERAMELAFWESVQASENPAAFEAYLGRYPEGAFAALAELRIRDLAERQEAALAVPPASLPAEPGVVPPSPVPEPDQRRFEVEDYEGNYRVASSGMVNLRSGPGTDYEPIGLLRSGERLRVTGRVTDRNWFQVATAGGQEGYVFGDLLDEVSPWPEPAEGAPLPVSPAATTGRVSLAGGFLPDPHSLSVRAGGSTSLQAYGSSCYGNYAGTQPTVELSFSSPSSLDLSIFVDSASDTTLAVRDPGGRWHCNDDYHAEGAGLNPAVVFSDPLAGTYGIWVGTFSENTTAQATLKISELGPSWGGTGGSVAGTGSSRGSADIEWGDNTSRWANDGECDDPRFAGEGMAVTLIEQDRFHDANDCRMLFEQGRIHLR